VLNKRRFLMYIKSITVAVIALSVSACSVSMQEANSVDYGAKPRARA
jgi:hypothetical protein